jgi:hypothetical protein
VICDDHSPVCVTKPFANPDTTADNCAMHIVGHRTPEGRPMADQGSLARTAAFLRGTSALVPRGVYRFSSFDEADTWLINTIQSTHARLTRTTSSASAAR